MTYVGHHWIVEGLLARVEVTLPIILAAFEVLNRPAD